MHYKLIESQNREEFEHIINKYLEAGYQLHGDTQTVNVDRHLQYAQVVVFDDQASEEDLESEDYDQWFMDVCKILDLPEDTLEDEIKAAIRAIVQVADPTEPKRDHPQIDINIGNKIVTTDVDMIALLRTLNEYGIVTTGHCIGNGGENSYVAIDLNCLEDMSVRPGDSLYIRWKRPELKTIGNSKLCEKCMELGDQCTCEVTK